MDTSWTIESLKTFIADKFTTGQGDFYGGMFAWAIIGLLGFIAVWIYKGSLFSYLFFRRQVIEIPRSLRAYKKELTKATLTIRHSWQLDGQEFEKMLVPMHLELEGSGLRMSIGIFLRSAFQPDSVLRCILTGQPGSGKSVAMGSIAREIWQLGTSPTTVPVLLTFSDIKHVRTREEMETAVIHSMQKYQFEKGKRTRRACDYAEHRLYSGQLFLLLDGFDELEKSARHQIALFLEEFFSTYPSIPFVISCRTAVWKDSPGAFKLLGLQEVSMVRFNTSDIRQFLSGWQFQGTKSSEQLGELIRTKSYLLSIAENPLMLTIIAYLYAQPKRILPDNRVKFYQECVDALMEKFDNTKMIARANEFQTVDKVTILSHIAYQHIVDAETTDSEIQRELVLSTVKAVMEKLSRPVEKRSKMLTEIVQNTELLVELPPDHFKFPHRTYMEYFAANYFMEEDKSEELLNLYSSDKGKWQETLILYCGMNLNEGIANKCLQALEQNFNESLEGENPNMFVFRVLVESAKVRPEWSLPLLNKAEEFLQKRFDYELVECLGYIAANPNLVYAPRAAEILMAKLSHQLSNPEITALLIALSAYKDGQSNELIAKYLGNITPEGIYELLKHDVQHVAPIIQQFNHEKLEEFIAKVQENGDLGILLNILGGTSNPEVKCNCALAISAISLNPGFYNILDASGDVILSNDEQSTYELFKDWNWAKYQDFGPIGKKWLSLIIHYLIWGYKEKGRVFDEKYVAFSKSNFIKFHFHAAYHSRGLMKQSPYFYCLVNIPIKYFKSAWERVKPFEKVQVKSTDIFVIAIMLLWIWSFVFFNSTLYTMFLFSITVFSLLILIGYNAKFNGKSIIKYNSKLELLIQYLLSHFSSFDFFQNKRINFIFSCAFLVINSTFVVLAQIAFEAKVFYLICYAQVFFQVSMKYTGLLFFILLPDPLNSFLVKDEDSKTYSDQKNKNESLGAITLD
jgi:hypothetical protein